MQCRHVYPQSYTGSWSKPGLCRQDMDLHGWALCRPLWCHSLSTSLNPSLEPFLHRLVATL